MTARPKTMIAVVPRSRCVGLNKSVTAGGVAYANCLETEETTPLEPDVLENKFYAPNAGNVLTVDTVTGERSELIRIEIE